MHNVFGITGASFHDAWITQYGVDGTWVGADKNDSYFSILVAPGVHHVCISADAHITGHVVEFVHFTAVAGSAYYFRIRNFMWKAGRLDVEIPDSDQAAYMIQTYPLSVTTLK